MTDARHHPRRPVNHLRHAATARLRDATRAFIRKTLTLFSADGKGEISPAPLCPTITRQTI